MNDGAFTESTVEEAALAWLETTGWQVAHGPDIAPDALAAKWADSGWYPSHQAPRNRPDHG